MATRLAYRSTAVSTLNSWLSVGDTVIFQESGTWNLNYPGSATGALNLGSNAKITKASGVGEVILKMGTTSRTYIDDDYKTPIGPQWTAWSPSSERGMISAVSASNITIENVTIDGSWSSNTYLGSSNNITLCLVSCSSIVINNCIFRYGQSDFIRARKCNNITVSNCTASYSGHEFLYCLYSNNVKFFNNNVIIRTNSAIRLAGGCNIASIYNNTLDGNINNTYGTSSGPIIEINVGDSTSYPTDNVRIYNNTFKNSRGAGIWAFCKTPAISVSKNIYVYDNTFTNVGTGTWGYAGAALNIFQLNNFYIERNTFTNVGPSTSRCSLKIYAYTTAASVITFIYFRRNIGTQTISNPYSSHIITTTGTNVTTPTGSTPTIPDVYPSVTLTTNTSSIVSGNSATLTWSTTNCTSAILVTYVNNVATNSKTLVLGNGLSYNTGTVPVTPTANSIYILTGTYANVSPPRTTTASTQINVSAHVIPAPACTSFYIEDSSLYSLDLGKFIALGITNATSGNLRVQTGINEYQNVDVTSRMSTGAFVVNIAVYETGSRTAVLTLTGPGGTKTYSTTFTVIAPPTPLTPTLTFNTTANVIDEGYDVRLSWSTTNATKLTITPGGGDAINIGSADIAAGSLLVQPLSTTTYTAVATNVTTYGSPTATKTITITVNPYIPAVPVILLHTTAETIDIDQSATISWVTENAATLECNHSIGSLTPASGSITVWPTVETEYTFTADGDGGATNRSITIDVESGDIIKLFKSSPETVYAGDPVTLSWLMRFGKYTSIDNDIGSVTPASYGTYVVYPTESTTYELTISGSLGVETITADVVVLPELSVNDIAAQFTIDKPILRLGEEATISWETQNATVMACGQDIGFVDVSSGSLTVTPSVTTDYSFIVATSTESREYIVPIYVVDNYEFVIPVIPTYSQEYIDMTGKRIYVSGGQSTSDTSYTWDIDTNASMRPNPDNEMITFAYDESGYYMITLTSINRDGEVLKQTVRANVLNE